MDEKIKEAIELLQHNGYIVYKMTQRMHEAADRCVDTGYGECSCCPCFICAAGIE